MEQPQEESPPVQLDDDDEAESIIIQPPPCNKKRKRRRRRCMSRKKRQPPPQPHVRVQFWNTDNNNDDIDDRIPSPWTITDFLSPNVNHEEEEEQPPPQQRTQMIQLWNQFWKQQQPSPSSPMVPTCIQLYTWPILLLSTTTTVILIAPTASGKTWAYGIPALFGNARFLSSSSSNTNTNANHNTTTNTTMLSVILTPTRELARQVQTQLQPWITRIRRWEKNNQDDDSKNHHHRNATIMTWYGGGGGGGTTTTTVRQQCQQFESWIIASSQQQQQQQQSSSSSSSSSAALVIAATPGRCLDVLQSISKSTTRTWIVHGMMTRWLILDEADRLASGKDMCQSVNEIQNILESSTTTPTRMGIVGRTIVCSATFPKTVTPIWNRWIKTRNPTIMIQMNTMEISQSSSSLTQKQKPLDWSESEQSDEIVCHNEKVTIWTNNTTTNTPQSNSDTNNNNNNNNAMSMIATQSSNDGNMISKIPAHVIQIVHVCAEHKKPRKLVKILNQIMMNRTSTNHQQQQNNNNSRRCRTPHLGIIFCARIKTILYLSKLFISTPGKSSGSSSPPHFPKHVILHGQLSQPVRERHLDEFRSGKCPILIATDVAARGMHVKHVSWIIQYDFPDTLEQYVHRCGRVGRTIHHHHHHHQQQHSDPSNNNNNNDSILRNNTPVATTPTIKNTVYSFYTRPSRQQQQQRFGVTPSDLLTLLEATQQSYIDPNLRALAAAESSIVLVEAGSKKAAVTNIRKNTEDTKDEDDSKTKLDDPYPELSAHRVILKRASNMSSASEASSDDDDNKSEK
jgi:superfamily II DNA/RNA helicase